MLWTSAPQKISFNLVRDWIRFVGYKVKNWKIRVWKNIKKWFLDFMDYVGETDFTKYKLNREEQQRIKSMYYSRVWCFQITNHGKEYVQKIWKNKV